MEQEKILNQENPDQNAPKKKKRDKYRFKYLSNPGKHLRNWVDSTPDFLNYGKIEYFYGFLCPVSTASVKVLERANSDYDTLELTILKLYDAGIKDSKVISLLMGINEKMVVNILNILKNTYHHIDDGKLTAEGRTSLNEQKNIQVYETIKTVQFEALTGSIIPPSLSQNMLGIEAYYDQKNIDEIKRFLPKRYIEKNVYDDLIDHLSDHKMQGVVSRNVEKIISLKIDNIIYTEAFLIKYDFLLHPFILFPVLGRNKTFWNPVSISKAADDAMKKKNLIFKFKGDYIFDAPVKDAKDFIELANIENSFNLRTPKMPLSQTYSRKRPKDKDNTDIIVETFFKLASKNDEGAFIDTHPDSPYTPVYSVIIDEKEYPATKEADK
ncbi:MAG: hypothetical protein E7404_05555 [Ruminococcaceae bacterium]|nr:hypothetical protein [Oscillospiraceae bacterium]